MARHYEERTRTDRYLKRLTCDLCGRESLDGEENWGPQLGGYDTHRTDVRGYAIHVEWKEGKSYPEAQYGNTIRADICPHCFLTKLVPWLRSQGAQIEQEEYSW